MAIKNQTVKQIFDDLDKYLDWCRTEGKVYDEAALYNKADPNWQQYERYLSYVEGSKKTNKSRVRR